MDAEVKSLNCFDCKSCACIVVVAAPLTEYVVRSLFSCYGNLNAPDLIGTVRSDYCVVTGKCERVFAAIFNKADSNRRTVCNYLNVSGSTDCRSTDNICANDIVENESRLSVYDSLCSCVNRFLLISCKVS